MKKTLSIFLATLFLLTTLPVGIVSASTGCTCIYDGAYDRYCNLCGCIRPRTAPDIVASGDTGFSWTLDATGTLTVSGYSPIPPNAVQNYLSDYRLQIRQLIVEEDVTIGNYAFSGCTNLQTANLARVSSVGDYAFSGCTALEWVEMANARTVGACAFNECASLATVFLGSYVYDRTIGDYAFYMCTSLREVALYSGATLGHSVFGGCSSLDSVYLYSRIDNFSGKSQTSFSLTTVSDTFEGVTATLWYPPSDRRYDGWSENAVKGTYGGTLTSAMSTSALCGAAVYGEYTEGILTVSGTGSLLRPQSGMETWWYAMQESVLHLILEDGIDDLPSYCFEYYESLQTIRLPNTLRRLDCNAFNDCGGVSYLVVPASLEQVGARTHFARCDALKDIYYMGTERDWAAISNAADMTYYGETVHYLTYTPQTGSCTAFGYEAYYQFEDGFGLYDAEKQPIKAAIARPAPGHTYDNTCDTDCNVCGALRTIIHDYEGDVIEPDCEHGGYTTYTCTVCGDSYVADATSALGHKYDNVCDADCNRCGMGRVPADHTYDSACDIDCNTCGTIRTITHTYEGVVTEPDCEHGGYTTYICSVCGDSYVADGPSALGHTYDNTCDTDCNVCGATRAITHDYEGDVTEPDCEHGGYTTYICSVCGDSYVADATCALGHKYDNVCDADCNRCGMGRVPADHTYDSACDIDCNTCGTIRTITHTYEGVVTEPDCEHGGYTTYICSVCGDSYVADGPSALGHIYDNVCDADCNRCGAGRVPADHTYDSACDTDCKVCGAVREITHTYSFTCDGDCNVCGAVREAPHTYDNACDAYCNTCSARRGVPDHTYSGTCDYDCNACSQLRVAPHNYAHSCDDTCDACGEFRDAEDHIYDNAYDPDCNVCGAVREVEEIPADAPAFVVEGARVLYGNTFTVAIRTQNNPGLVAFRLRVQYDTSLLELISAEEAAFAGVSFGPLTTAPFTFTWCDAIHPDNTADDTVVLLTFRAKEGFDPTETVITLSYDADDVYNAAWENVYFNTVSGTVQLTNVTPGDANGDGKVNVKDLGLLQQHLNGWDVTMEAAAMDVNGDGKINVKDLGLLQQFLNGWDVVLGQPQ